ncbi:unnamed protein product [Clavelina lepadiformis]|uniref:Uncharacterized protein n=1 Tax=Clavelina lepadiformis TaxID=159417 RepID=A0ABP0F7Q4_CLALP
MKIASMLYINGWGKETLSGSRARFLVAIPLKKGVIDEPEFVQQKCTPMMIFGRCDDNTARCKMKFSLGRIKAGADGAAAPGPHPNIGPPLH